MLNIVDRERVRTLVLDRPEALNAFDAAQYDAVAEALLAAGADDGCRVAVLTGAGRAFSAGADVAEMAGGGSPATHGFRGMVRVVSEFPKPLVLAVNGLGVGLGATLAGLADFVFMAESARLRCPFSELGLVAEAGSTATFPALMGRQRAMWFLMAAEWMSAAECKAAGLALDVFPDAQFAEQVQRKAAHLAALPGASLAAAKALIVDGERLQRAIDAENAALEQLFGGPANREALAAFLAKRRPDFSAL